MFQIHNIICIIPFLSLSLLSPHRLRFVWFVIVVIIVCTGLGFKGGREGGRERERKSLLVVMVI